MSITIQICIDDDWKIKADQLFKELLTDTTTAIRVFLTQTVANKGVPFEIKRTARNPSISLSEEGIKRMEKSRESESRGKYKSPESVISDMRERCGLYFYILNMCMRKILSQMKNQ